MFVAGHTVGLFFVKCFLLVILASCDIQQRACNSGYPKVFQKCIYPNINVTATDVLCRYMADIIIAFLQDELARLLVDPVSPQEIAATTEELPPPMLPGNYEHSSICLEEQNLRSAVVRSKVRVCPQLLLLLCYILSWICNSLECNLLQIVQVRNVRLVFCTVMIGCR